MQIIPYHKSFRNGRERLITSLNENADLQDDFVSTFYRILQMRTSLKSFLSILLSDYFIVLFFLVVSPLLIYWINHRQTCKYYSVDVIVIAVVVVVSISICSRVCDFTLENDCRRRRLDYKRSIDLFCSCYFSGSSHIYFHDLSNVISAMKLIVSHQLFAVEAKDK